MAWKDSQVGYQAPMKFIVPSKYVQPHAPKNSTAKPSASDTSPRPAPPPPNTNEDHPPMGVPPKEESGTPLEKQLFGRLSAVTAAKPDHYKLDSVAMVRAGADKNHLPPLVVKIYRFKGYGLTESVLEKASKHNPEAVGCVEPPPFATQCAFPYGEAVERCLRHPHCVAISCYPPFTYCQARGHPIKSGSLPDWVTWRGVVFRADKAEIMAALEQGVTILASDMTDIGPENRDPFAPPAA